MTTSSKLEVDDERDEFFIISTDRQTDSRKKTTYDKQTAEWREREREFDSYFLSSSVPYVRTVLSTQRREMR